MDFLKQELFLGLSYLQIIGVVVGLIVFGSILTKLRGMGGKVKFVKKKCRACQWEGPAGPDTKKCPKCSAPLYTIQG